MIGSEEILGNHGILFFHEGGQNFEPGGLGLSVQSRGLAWIPAASRRPCRSGENEDPRFVSGHASLAGVFLQSRKSMQLGLSLLVSTEAHDCKAGTRQQLFTIQCLFNERNRESC